MLGFFHFSGRPWPIRLFSHLHNLCVLCHESIQTRAKDLFLFPLDEGPVNGDIPKVNRQWIQNRISDWIEIIYLVCVEHGVCECYAYIWKNIPLHSIPFHLKWSNPCSLFDFLFWLCSSAHIHTHIQFTRIFMNPNGIINIFFIHLMLINWRWRDDFMSTIFLCIE